jgi:hypothetical protein
VRGSVDSSNQAVDDDDGIALIDVFDRVGTGSAEKPE